MSSNESWSWSSSSSTDEAADAAREEIQSQLRARVNQHNQRLVARAASRVERPISQPDHTRIIIPRGRVSGACRLFNDYFADPPCFPDYKFRRRFRMPRNVFVRIIEELKAHYPYFTQRSDAAGRPGLSPYQKCVAAMRIISYGVPADSVDEYVRIGESTTMECLKKFVDGVIAIFGEEYLRRPRRDDIVRLLDVADARGFPGMLGSIDCLHWAWENCPVAWHGQYARGDHGFPTIILEAVASYDTWIWHAFFGVPGTNNDINVLERSPVFDDILNEWSVPVNFTVNEHNYNIGYYLADGIYPEYATLMKSARNSLDPKAKLFTTRQESYRKDVERAFGVLKKRFAIIKGPARQIHQHEIGNLMKACIILHNMVVEEERDSYSVQYDVQENDPTQPEIDPTINMQETRGAPVTMERYIANRARVRDRNKHRQLKQDLIEHIWQRENGTI